MHLQLYLFAALMHRGNAGLLVGEDNDSYLDGEARCSVVEESNVSSNGPAWTTVHWALAY